MSLLYGLARGHALVHGRRQLTTEDLPIVARAALESAPNDRRAVMRILLANEGIATTADLQRELRCSAPTARAILETLDKLGIGRLDNPGPPEPATLTLDADFRWLLSALKENGRRADWSEGIETESTPCSIDEATSEDDAAGEGLDAPLASYWLCRPCGTGTAETRVSLSEPACRFCGRKYREEYRARIDETA